ncbi:MAG: biopolymer transporter ExbD [Deltaproteobacteria bacterium]|nr:MAG: biopolymer transporter ExbD [Deltaproteobacteria bacterium]
MTRARKRNGEVITLNLTSMMDMFTIILVFLLTQISAQGQLLTVGENTPLPYSTSRKEVRPAVTVAVVGGTISVDGEVVERNFLRYDGMLIDTLKAALDRKAKKLKEISKTNPTVVFRGEVLILADKTIPFKHLKKILYTCGQTEFINQSLAVLQK